jgi:putative protease
MEWPPSIVVAVPILAHQRFGARSNATNSIEDIAALVRYAHLFHAQVFVVYEYNIVNELETCRQMIWALYKIGVDALIVRDSH